MALADYDGLKASVADFLNKTNLTSQIPDFITLAEAQLNLDLDCREMSGLAILSISQDSYPLPCDFDAVLSLRLDGDVKDIPAVSPDQLDGFPGVGKPAGYAVMDRLIFAPAPDANYQATMRYRKRIPALSSSNKCNWLLKRHPGAYLYGSLLQAAPYLRDDERISVWSGLYTAAVDALNQNEKRTVGKLNARGRAF